MVGLGGGNTLNIAGTLTNQLGGQFILNGPGDAATLGSITNNFGGTVDVEGGSTLTVNGNVNNSFDVYTGANGSGQNMLTVSGTLTNEASGRLILNGPNDRATLGGLINLAGLGSAGFVDVERGSTLQITGDVANSGSIYTDYYSKGGGNTLMISGNLTNTKDTFFVLGGLCDMANVGTFANNGFTVVGTGATLNLTNQPSGITDALAGSDFELYGTFTAGGNPGFANLNTVERFAAVDLYGQNLTITSGSGTLKIVSLGFLSANDNPDTGLGTTLAINGNVTNSGTMETNANGYGGGNTITISGELNNNPGASFLLYGPGDKATVGSLENAGLIDLENASSLTVTGDVNNGGDLYTSESGGSGHNTITIGGELTFSPGGQVKLFNLTDKLVINGGGSIELLHGAALSTPTLNNGGTINVDSLSTLLVGLGGLHGPSYNYTQLANGTLGEIINSPTSYGTITVSGSALLAGTLDILLRPGFNPTVGSEFTFITGSGQLSGAFSSILNQYFDCNGVTCEYFSPDYNYASPFAVTLDVTLVPEPTPEPATLLVLIPGLLGMGYGLRRKLLGWARTT
jgi:hypothetical protein